MRAADEVERPAASPTGVNDMAKKASRSKKTGSSAKRSSKGQKRTPSAKRAGAGGRAAARSGAGARRVSKAGRNTGRKTAGAKTPRGKKKATPSGAGKRTGASKRTASPRASSRRVGGTGIERELAQTPETGRSVRGPTNPMPTRRSTGTAAGAGGTKQAPGLERERRRLREVEETVPGPPSSLDLDRRPSAARTGRHELQESRREHPEVSPELTAGDVDADWEDAYSVGDEAPGGDNPTPDQDRVDDIGKALGVQYEDNEELKAADKITERDRHRWELDPASSDDYKDRD
jgi:hypothetical protein